MFTLITNLISFDCRKSTIVPVKMKISDMYSRPFSNMILDLQTNMPIKCIFHVY